MATVTLTFTDTPTHGVSVHSSLFRCAGIPLTPAQATALDLYTKACHQWCLAPSKLNAVAALQAFGAPAEQGLQADGLNGERR